MSSPAIDHRLIIRRQQSPMILLHAENGAWHLPRFAADDHHTADVEFINAAVAELCGLDTTVLRCLQHTVTPDAAQTERVFELESHTREPVRGGPWRWYGRDELVSLRWSSPADAQVVHDWVSGGAPPGGLDGGGEWTQAGWWDTARVWVAEQLRRSGAGRIRDAQQVRVWEFSCVFRVRAEHATFYLKALPTQLARECVVTEYLSREVGGCAPAVVAVEPLRRWLLMRAAPGVNLEQTTDVVFWQRGVAAYARLQVACIERVSALRRLGCTERPLDRLAGEFEALLADTAALLPGEAAGLTPDEVTRVQSAHREVTQRCAALAACRIPLTIDHGDLWPANVLLDNTVCTVIDWEDAAIGHPFLSLAPLLVGARVFHPALDVRQLARALEAPYQEPFQALAAGDTVKRAAHLARPLGMLDLALRYWRQPPSVVRMHPWMRENVPFLLRIMLSELES
jgi:aminoglycoside phosphotransferase